MRLLREQRLLLHGGCSQQPSDMQLSGTSEIKARRCIIDRKVIMTTPAMLLHMDLTAALIRMQKLIERKS